MIDDNELMELVKKLPINMNHPLELKQWFEFYKEKINKTPEVPKEGFTWLVFDSNKKYTRFEVFNLLTPLDRLRCEIAGNMIPMDTYHKRGIPVNEKTDEYQPDNEEQARWLGMQFRGKKSTRLELDPIEWMRPLNVGFQVPKPNSFSRAELMLSADYLGYGIKIVKEDGLWYVQRLA